MSEPKTIIIKGQAYSLPPFNAGQMRYHVDPLLKRTRAVFAKLQEIQAVESGDESMLIDLGVEQREISAAHGELVHMALKNQYPDLTLEDVETLTPNKLTLTFNLILEVTSTGSNEPGEVIPPRIQKKSR